MFVFFFKEAMQLWFGKSLATDLEVKTRFGHLVEAAFRYMVPSLDLNVNFRK